MVEGWRRLLRHADGDDPAPPPGRVVGASGNAAGPRVARGGRCTALALAAYAAAAVLAFGWHDPLSARELPGGGLGDAVQMAWFLAWTPHAVLHGLDPFVTSALDHPGVVDLADNTSVPLLGILAAPVTLTLGPVVALNLLLRAALLASAAAAYFLLRRRCSSRLAAFLGGAVYAFGPFVAEHASPGANLDLVMVPLPPLVLAALDELLVRRRRSALGAGLVLGALCAAQLLVAPEVLVELGVTGVSALALLAALPASRRRLRALCAGAGRRLAAGTAAATAVVVALAAAPVWAALAAPGHLSGPVQAAANLQRFRLDPASLVLPPARQLIDVAPLASAGRALLASAAHAGSERGGYLGVPLLALALALLVCWRRRLLVVAAAAFTGAALVCSLGSPLELAGHSTAVPLPEGVLAAVPLVQNVVPDRFALEVALGLGALVAFGLDLSLGAARTRARRAGLLAAAAVGLACYLPAYPLATRPLPDERAVLDALRNAVPPGGVVLTYPYALPPYDEAMLWQALDGMRVELMGGYATVPAGHGTVAAGTGQWWPPLLAPASVQESLERDELGRALHYPPGGRRIPAAALCRYLDAYGVGAVVMRLGRRVPNAAAAAASFTAAFGRPRRVDGGALLWQRDAPAGATPARGGGGRSWHCRAGLSPRPLSSAPSGG